MKNNHTNIFTPFFKTIDKVIFGIEEESEEVHALPEIKEWVIQKNQDEQEDKVVVRSIN